jgi:hypothetical protein
MVKPVMSMFSNDLIMPPYGCDAQIFDQPSVGASEYSWCKPPRIGFARTSASDAKR